MMQRIKQDRLLEKTKTTFFHSIETNDTDTLITVLKLQATLADPKFYYWLLGVFKNPLIDDAREKPLIDNYHAYIAGDKFNISMALLHCFLMLMREWRQQIHVETLPMGIFLESCREMATTLSSGKIEDFLKNRSLEGKGVAGILDIYVKLHQYTMPHKKLEITKSKLLVETEATETTPFLRKLSSRALR